MEEIKAAKKDPITKVFVMDHDFVCISRQKLEEYDSYFSRGLDFYLTGDCHPARVAFQGCERKIDLGEVPFKHDGPLKRLCQMIDDSKMLSPDDWSHGGPNAYDWDKKPVPPDVDFNYANEDDESEEITK